MHENKKVFRPNFLITRIGETAVQLGLFARLQELGWLEPTRGIVLAPQQYVVNEYLLDYFTPWIELERQRDPVHIPSYDGTSAQLANGSTVGYDRAIVAVNKVWEEQGRPPLLKLKDAHREAGEKGLEMLGLPRDAWFVALHAREGGYVRAQGHVSDDHNDYRNVDIDMFTSAVQSIVDAGGWVIRLGDPTMKPMKPIEGVIDYAHHNLRNQWFDLYLMAAARFMLATTSGPVTVAPLFGVPVAVSNYIPFFERPTSGRDLFISKIYLRDGKPVPFEELMRPPFRSHDPVTLPLQENNPDEIRELALEMMANLDGNADYTEDDEALQSRISGLSEEFEPYGVASRMGRDFLRRHRDLLV